MRSLLFPIIVLGLVAGSITVGVRAQSQTQLSASQNAASPLIGLKMPAWKIGASNWMNTPAPVSLSSLSGHVTVIEFFRFKCVHCKAAINSRRALFAKYQPQGLKMVGFQSPGDISDPRNQENYWSMVKPVISSWKLPYPVAFDAKRALFDQCGLSLYPTVIVLDRAGVVRFVQSGYTPKGAQQLDKFVGQLIKSGT